MLQNNSPMRIDCDTGVKNISTGKRKGGSVGRIVTIYNYTLVAIIERV
jgi:hypothetical protein